MTRGQRLTGFVGVIWVFVCLSSLRADPPVQPAKQPEMPFKQRYTTYKVHDYLVHVNKDLLTLGNEKVQIAMDILEDRLVDAAAVIPKGALKQLEKIPFFVEAKNSFATAEKVNGVALASMYFPIGQKYEGVPVEKQGGIEIAAPAFLLEPWQKSTNKLNPYWMLHEMAHAYHDRVLGMDNKRVREAYNSAQVKKLYDEVEMKTIGWNNRIEIQRKPAYARTNELEYFAELSVAYLAENWQYPYTAESLRKHDPSGYALMKEVWGERIEKKKP